MREWLSAGFIIIVIIGTVLALSLFACTIADKHEIENFRHKVEILQEYNLINENDDLLKTIMLKGEAK